MIAAALSTLSHLWSEMLHRPSLFLLAMALLLFTASWGVQWLARRLGKRSLGAQGRIPLAKGELS